MGHPATLTAEKRKTPKRNNAAFTGPFLSVARRVEDFLIPPLCIVCDKKLDGSSRWFCTGCIDSLTVNHAARNACPRCAVNRSKRECACEFAWDFPFEKIFSIYDYDDTLSVVAKHIKYKGKSQLAYHIGAISANFIPDDFWAGIDFVIPVPLHKSRMRKRGYNQAEHFAQGLLKGLEPNPGTCGDTPLHPDGMRPLSLRADILTRTRNTGTQTRLDREGRLENLAGAFAVNQNRTKDIKGKKVILVDDILTTGATTEACTDELLRGGCAAVRVLSLGRD
ncbi:MAG: hypothetical protein FWB85_07245 [Chitinispirillia bacterium]|nr:hypothetical protein [Chitinispirillia bacterium]MCL2242043.1 hypothetical protein [Chitinispirillia bacterium]